MISEALAECLRYDSFNPGHQTKWAREEHKYLSRNTALTKAMIVNIKPHDTSFIPTALFKRIYEVRHKIPNGTSVSVMCPLTVTCGDDKKAPDTIIRRLFSVNDHFGLIKVKTGKGMDYIGGTGLIFDQNWVPLMMTGMEIDNFLGTSNEASPISPILYVNPEVFEREDSISRAIVKKLIPWYGSNLVYSSIIGQRNTLVNQTIRIRVEDFSHMFINPNPPKFLFEEDIEKLCRDYATAPSHMDYSQPEDYYS